MTADTDKKPSELRRLAAGRLAAGDFAGVEKWCRQALRHQQSDAEAWYLLGSAAFRAGKLDAAQSCLQEAVQYAPEQVDYLVLLARSYSVAWRHSEAAAVARRAVALEPADAASLNIIGEILLHADQPAEARPLFESAVARAPGVTEYHFNLASACRVLGDLAVARQQCEVALDCDPGNARAWSMLAELNSASLAGKRFDLLSDAYAASASKDPQQRLLIGFALSRAWEAQGKFDKAFDVLHESKAPARRLLNYTFASDAALFDTLTEIFSGQVRTDETGSSAPERPIFVMGMPRTGTTVLDRMLSAHPAVISAGEVHNFGILLQRAAGDAGLGVPTPERLRKALNVDLQEVAERYLESVAERVGTSGRFVDKLPHNFLFAGYIAKAMPEAKMLCLRRNAMDTCVGNFRQLFALNFPYYRYSYDIDDIARYYIAFDRLMAHWQKVLPGRILEISYEGLVRDPETRLKEILNYCGLDWDPACLAIEDNPGPVTSASAVQVREAINTRAIGRWRKYEAKLGSVIEMLGDAGVDIETD